MGKFDVNRYFSQRGKDRPNQIGMSSVQIVSTSEDKLTVKGLDAIDEALLLMFSKCRKFMRIYEDNKGRDRTSRCGWASTF